jgi:hypothetical protein
MRRIAIGALVVAGTLVVLSGLRGGRGPLGELVTLIALVTVVFFAGRMGWRWWQGQPPAIATTGVIAALGVTGVGWLLIALVHALSRVSSENYGMIVVWPLVFVAGLAAIAGGVVAVSVGVAAILTVLRRPHARRALIVCGGGAAVVLNLAHAVVLVRLLLTG